MLRPWTLALAFTLALPAAAAAQSARITSTQVGATTYHRGWLGASP